jgi:hypothetical protein
MKRQLHLFLLLRSTLRHISAHFANRGFQESSVLHLYPALLITVFSFPHSLTDPFNMTWFAGLVIDSDTGRTTTRLPLRLTILFIIYIQILLSIYYVRWRNRQFRWVLKSVNSGRNSSDPLSITRGADRVKRAFANRGVFRNLTPAAVEGLQLCDTSVLSITCVPRIREFRVGFHPSYSLECFL